MGIVAVATLALVIPIIAYFVWKHRREEQGARVVKGPRRTSRLSMWDLPSPANRIVPFTLHSPSSSTDSAAGLMPNAFASTVGTRTLNISKSRYILGVADSPLKLFQRHPSPRPGRDLSTRSLRSRGRLPLLDHFHPVVRSPHKVSFLCYALLVSLGGHTNHVLGPHASYVPFSRPQQSTVPLPMNAEVVENLWQEFAQRIDRGPPPRKSGVTIAPPRYPSSPPQLGPLPHES